MGLPHWLLDVVWGTALLLWTPLWARLSLAFLLSIGWRHKQHPPPGRRKVLAWRAGLTVAASALLATPPLVLWFGITRGFWITVTVQAALCAAALCFLPVHAARRHRRRPPPTPEALHPYPPQPTPQEPEPPTPAS